MRVSAVVALGAVALWGLSFTTPGDAGTVRSSGRPLRAADVAGNDELRSLANTSSSFDPSSESYLFESADLARVISNDSGCKNFAPDTVRGSGGSGSKRRHAAPSIDPCRHGVGAGSTATLVLSPLVASPSCSGGGVQPAGQPVGGTSGKKRHPAPLGQTPCRPRAHSTDSDPMVLGLTFGVGETGKLLPPEESTNPGGGSNGKHRHSPPSPPQIPGATSEIAGTPEPGGLILLGSGLLMMGVVLRRRAVRASHRAR